ncbi:hypothetical protein AA0313_0836 [Acetobacter indonesiensis NRIC 0313]|uniref:Uncharacterized protein n=1 Tax=Acetobacter indonesiensis TaxID=104101 RepID=A0A6N3T997_9PROT|nr:hypothetical protein Abin_081_053 [Acetobacter indonesiensis]GBQ55380.1 hypothetical protein AA0313_0836 [Acetobacter indonesiensis NRIC 0313]GEN04179.1 hypothetical protein AIN02nite_22040 [Acetobacter indonesiensis]
MWGALLSPLLNRADLCREITDADIRIMAVTWGREIAGPVVRAAQAVEMTGEAACPAPMVVASGTVGIGMMAPVVECGPCRIGGSIVGFPLRRRDITGCSMEISFC